MTYAKSKIRKNPFRTNSEQTGDTNCKPFSANKLRENNSLAGWPERSDRAFRLMKSNRTLTEQIARTLKQRKDLQRNDIVSKRFV